MAFAEVLVMHRYVHEPNEDMEEAEGDMYVTALPMETVQDKLDGVAFFLDHMERFSPFFRSQPIVESIPRLVDGEFEDETVVMLSTAVKRSTVMDPSMISDTHINEHGDESEYVVCSMTFPLGSRTKKLRFFEYLQNEFGAQDNVFRAHCTQLYKSRMARVAEEQPRKRPMAALHIMADALFERKEELTDEDFLNASNRLKRAFDEL
tara:strand:- start:7034 stop:7654 length:621 start_codon:yes stop_codon:yes gene_type:complete